MHRYLTLHSTPEPALLCYLSEATRSAFPTSAHMLCGPLVGQFLKMLVQVSHAKNCLELGTFTGYSALWIAAGLPIDGHLITCDNDPRTHAIAQSFFERSPHGHKIQSRHTLATDTIATIDAPLDFIFMDADKKPMLEYYSQLIPKMRSGALMVVDNALFRNQVANPTDTTSAAIAALNAHICADTRVENVLLTVRDGLHLIRKI